MRKASTLFKVNIEPIQVKTDELIESLYQRPYPFFLESRLVTPLLGQYSFFGSDPFLVIKTKHRHITLIKNNQVISKQGNPFEELRRILSSYRIPEGDYPVPFIGGGVGYLGYDLCHFIERLPRTTRDDINLPDLFFAFYNRVIAIDHIKNKAYLISLTLPNSRLFSRSSKLEKPGSRRLPAFGETRLWRQPAFFRTLKGAATTALSLESVPKSNFLSTPKISEPKVENPKRIVYHLKSNPPNRRAGFTKADYLTAVRQVKEYIAAGDIYQSNLSQRFSIAFTHSPLQLYRTLRQMNPAPFAAFLKPNPHQIIISSSPERFLRMQHHQIETRPIKGTRPRGKTKKQDQYLKHELYHSEKDNAELAMIVDLERNDLGRVCKYGSVKVRQPKVLETYSTVHHLVAQVEGKLHPRYDTIDLLKATFPGGSITGAPKIRAMEIIDELEPTQRGPYTGAIGYLGFDNSIDLSIAIRIMTINNLPRLPTGQAGRQAGHRVHFQVGGGIVADSDPAQEYQETLDKGKALARAIQECG